MPPPLARLSPKRLHLHLPSYVAFPKSRRQRVEGKTDDPGNIGRQTANANILVKDGLEPTHIQQTRGDPSNVIAAFWC